MAALSVVALLSSGLLVNIGIVSAYQAGYQINNYMVITVPTMDGQWTTDDEWTDVDMAHQMDGDLDVTFRLKFDGNYPSWVNEYYLIEFFDDTTEDAEDYLQICYAAPSGSVTQTDPMGGTTPQTDCLRIDWVGHDQSGLTVYRGDGSGWVEFTDYTWPDHIEIVDSISPSPSDSNPHLIIEIKLEHIYLDIGTYQWIRLAVYDESNSGAGVQAWPDSSVNAPDEWGWSDAVRESVPEDLTFAVMVFLSSVSLMVGSHYLRKRSRKLEK